MPKPKDNSTFLEKSELRRRALAASGASMILETHGGFGHIFDALYRGRPGVVFEIKPTAARALAMQRPEWGVFCGDAVKMIAGGLGGVWPFDFIDLDPYGSPFELLEGLFVGGLQCDRIRFVVNDGLRQNIQLSGGWKVDAMREIIADFGNGLHGRYLAAAKEKTRRILDRGGFSLGDWFGYYCGNAKAMTHYTFTATRRP